MLHSLLYILNIKQRDTELCQEKRKNKTYLYIFSNKVIPSTDLECVYTEHKQECPRRFPHTARRNNPPSMTTRPRRTSTTAAFKDRFWVSVSRVVSIPSRDLLVAGVPYVTVCVRERRREREILDAVIPYLLENILSKSPFLPSIC